MPRVSVRLDAQVADYVAGMHRAQRETKELSQRLKITEREAAQAQRGLGQHADKSRASMQKVGDTALKAGAVGAAGLAAIGKAAIDWESAFAGVTKTLDTSNAAFGTAAEQTDKVEKGLRGLAKTMPTSHAEIAAVAEAAGQLGIAAPNVVAFTKVMVELGDTTNLTADEAATSLAQFMNIMGTAPGEVENLASALVFLGNNGASTESQILDLGQRLAGAGHQIGLSASEVLGFGSAIASVGVNAEAGGTAMSRIFGKMGAAVDLGGDKLDAFAKTAGVSTDEFSKMFKENASGAIDSFVEGLGAIQASGGNVRQALKDVGVTGTYEIDVLSRLAGASKAMGRAQGIVTENLKNSDKGFKDNMALAKEAETRYNTTASRIAISWNKIKDAAITAGGAVLPVVAGIAEGIGKAADAFGKLPAPAQKSAVYLLAIGTAGLLALAGVVKVTRAVREVSGVLSGLRGSSSRAVSALGSVGAKAGGIGLGLVAGVGAIGLMEQKFNKVTPSLQEMNNQILEMAKNPGIDVNKLFKFQEMDDFVNLVHGGIDGLNDTMTRLGENNFGDKVTSALDSILGTTRSSTTQARAQLVQLDNSFQALAQVGAGDAVATEFKRMVDVIKGGGGDVQGRLKELTDHLPGYRDMVLEAARANGNLQISDEQMIELMSGTLPAGFKTAAAAAGGAAAGNKKVGDTAKDAAIDIKKLTDALNESASAALAASGGARGVQAAINNASRASKTYIEARRTAGEQEARDAGKSEKAVTRAGDAAARMARQAIATGKAFHGTSDESLALQEALDGVAAASLTNLDAMVKNGASAEEVGRANDKARAAFLNAANAMGVGKREAQAMADEYFALGNVDAKPKITAPDDKALTQARLTREEFDNLPKEVRAKIISAYDDKGRKEGDRLLRAAGKKRYHPRIDVQTNANKKEAETRRKLQEAGGIVVDPQIHAHSNAPAVVQNTETALNNLNGKTVNVWVEIGRFFKDIFTDKPSDTNPNSVHNRGFVRAGGGPIPEPLARSQGGGIWGAGTTGSDWITVKASNNEYMQRAAAVEKYGVPFMHALNSLWIDPKDLPRFATGGSITPTPTFAAPPPNMTAKIDSNAVAAALAGMSGRRGGDINLYITNPQAEPTSASITAAAGYLAAR